LRERRLAEERRANIERELEEIEAQTAQHKDGDKLSAIKEEASIEYSKDDIKDESLNDPKPPSKDPQDVHTAPPLDLAEPKGNPMTGAETKPAKSASSPTSAQLQGQALAHALASAPAPTMTQQKALTQSEGASANASKPKGASLNPSLNPSPNLNPNSSSRPQGSSREETKAKVQAERKLMSSSPPQGSPKGGLKQAEEAAGVGVGSKKTLGLAETGTQSELGIADITQWQKYDKNMKCRENVEARNKAAMIEARYKGECERLQVVHMLHNVTCRKTRS
jgi:hypothetical protein